MPYWEIRLWLGWRRRAAPAVEDEDMDGGARDGVAPISRRLCSHGRLCNDGGGRRRVIRRRCEGLRAHCSHRLATSADRSRSLFAAPALPAA
ncbi:hypothetical protein PR202_gb26590 [Eleusine coracana subsp. coracana]|uniref:Uncharacterized protein n=1 Tax=Eleusine coracana subsp. coracana TaxID=191504 RepID=A0AAV5FRJ1_ELECO|nr:hypothetical protein PR202_gb26590 [Eleusine coracana subsp. coracana]